MAVLVSIVYFLRLLTDIFLRCELYALRKNLLELVEPPQWLPIAGFLAGVIAVNETERAGGIGSSGLAIFIAIAMLGIFDAYSGFVAVLGFWLTELLIGNISSFRDVLIMISVGISWLLPVLFASLIQTGTVSSLGLCTS